MTAIFMRGRSCGKSTDALLTIQLTPDQMQFLLIVAEQRFAPIGRARSVRDPRRLAELHLITIDERGVCRITKLGERFIDLT